MSNDPYFYVYKDAAGEWRWRLRSGGDIIADSAEGYYSKQGADRAIATVKRVVPSATIVHES